MYTCKYCGKIFENKYQVIGHCANCLSNPNRKERVTCKCDICNKEYKNKQALSRHNSIEHSNDISKGVSNESVSGNCIFCNKFCKNQNSLRNHERLCKQNPNRQLTKYENDGAIEGFNNKGRVAWNKGLTKETDERVAKIANTYIKNEKLGLHKSHSFSRTKEQKEKLSDIMKEIYSHKDVSVAGRAKMGWYKGIYCNSSWELAYVIYNLDHNVNFIRNKNGFKYIYEGSEHTYFPDFYLVDSDTYVEIKGYKDNKAKAKESQFKHNLIMLEYNEMQPILEYVISNYGKDFISLYEDK